MPRPERPSPPSSAVEAYVGDDRRPRLRTETFEEALERWETVAFPRPTAD
jgi:hypothetical protein